MGGPIEVNSTQVEGLIGSYMAVIDDGPLYVLNNNVNENDPNTSADDTYSIRVLLGTDQVDGSVQFSFLPAAPFFPLPYLDIPIHEPFLTDFAPSGTIAPGAVLRAAPRIAADPTDPNALHIVYADVVDPNYDPNAADVDIDVFYVKATRQSFLGSPYWAASTRLRVNDDAVDPNFPSDQFLPDIAVDAEGIIHVIFYDDRDFPAQNDSTTSPRFNVYYAVSIDGGASFEDNLHLYLDPNEPPESEPCHDEVNHDTSAFLEFGEYIGIAVRTIEEGVREIWTVYTGTSDIVMDDIEQSVIWSTRVFWEDEW